MSAPMPMLIFNTGLPGEYSLGKCPWGCCRCTHSLLSFPVLADSVYFTCYTFRAESNPFQFQSLFVAASSARPKVFSRR